jgi:hypothetical protein
MSLIEFIDGLLQELLIHKGGADIIQANRITLSASFYAAHPWKHLAEHQKKNQRQANPSSPGCPIEQPPATNHCYPFDLKPFNPASAQGRAH